MAALSPLLRLAAWRWRAWRWYRLPWGAPLLLLGVLALVVVAAWWCWLASARLTAVAQQQPLPPVSLADQDGVDGRRATLKQFMQGLPAADDAPAVVRSLFDLAEKEGLRLQRGSYRLQPEPAAAFARYRMTLPLRGDPARVQGFVQSALLAWPSLAVESIQFKREGPGQRQLEARIQWVLFVRADQPLATGSRSLGQP